MDYITCNHRRSKSKVSVDVCEKCKRMAKCDDYMGYRQPFLYPNFVKMKKISKETYRRTVKSNRDESDHNSRRDKHEQWTFDL